jgi:hypothetical protein
MAVRPYVTSGIALASAGLLVASLPTIAPSLTSRDIRVVADVQAQLSAADAGLPALPDAASLLEGLQLAANVDSDAPSTLQVALPTLQELVDAFFDGVTIPGVGDVPAGITGVVYVLTKAVLPNAPFVDSFFTGGFVAVVQEFLDIVIPGGDTMTLALADPTAQQLGDPTVLQDDVFTLQGLVDAFFDGYNMAPAGVTSAVYFAENTLLPPLLFPQNAGLDDAFFQGGFVEAAQFLLNVILGGDMVSAVTPLNAAAGAAAVGTLQQQEPDDVFTLQGLVDAFFDGYNAAPAGFTSAVYFSENTLLPPILFDQREGLDDAFFSGYPFDPEEPGPNGVVGVAHFVIDLALGDIPLPVNAAGVAGLADEGRQTELRTGFFGASETRNPVAQRFDLPTPNKVLNNLVPKAEDPADDSAAPEPTLDLTPAADKDDEEANGGDNGQRLVRNPLKFTPGSNRSSGSKSDSDASADSGFHPVKDFVSGIKNALNGDDTKAGDTEGGDSGDNAGGTGEGGDGGEGGGESGD